MKPLTAPQIVKGTRQRPCLNPTSIIYPLWREPVRSQKTQRTRNLEKPITILAPRKV